MTTRIFIPLGLSGGIRGDDLELRYALRSIAENWQGERPEITILGKPPEWSKNTAVIARQDGEKSRPTAALHGGSRPFLWWYDDCFLLKASDDADFALPRRSGNLATTLAANRRGNEWAKALARVTEELLAAGRSTHNFSGPHAPIFYRAEEFAAALSFWEGKWPRPLPLESWINNDGRPHRDASDVEARFRRETNLRPPREDARLLVVNDASIGPLWPWLAERFPEPSPWEK